MFYPQGNVYSQSSFNPQGQGFNPQGPGFNPQGQGFNPQAFNHPQGPQAFNPQGFNFSQAYSPFANSLYGSPQQTPFFAQAQSPYPSWQNAAQQQAALQQHAIQQLLAHQLATQQFGTQNLAGLNGIAGLSGVTGSPSTGSWPQQQQPHHHLLQQLAQYHYSIAQQLAQLSAQQALQGAGNPYAGQFIPGQFGAISGQLAGQLGPNFAAGGSYVPGGTMH